MDIKELLKKHYRKYPLMEIRDAAKLLYQRNFAGGHMIEDMSACIEFARREMDTVSPAAADPDILGNGLCRMHLSAARAAGVSPESVARMFAFTANSFVPRMDTFLKELSLLGSCGLFSEDAANAFLDDYAAMGYPALHHSDTFRREYSPAYRVVFREFCLLLPVIAKAEALLKEKEQIIILLDGRCGSGKSTLGRALAEALDANLFHTDDFFLQVHQRTAQRFQEPGGNIDYERLERQLLVPLARGSTVTMEKFSCSDMALLPPESYSRRPVNIIEGSYSMRPDFCPYADIKVFVQVSPETQLRRIAAREKGDISDFTARWIPLENRYFTACSVMERADFIVNNEEENR